MIQAKRSHLTFYLRSFCCFPFLRVSSSKTCGIFFLLYKRSPKSHSRAKPRPLEITYYVTTPLNFSGKLQEKFSWILLILEFGNWVNYWNQSFNYHFWASHEYIWRLDIPNDEIRTWRADALFIELIVFHISFHSS